MRAAVEYVDTGVFLVEDDEIRARRIVRIGNPVGDPADLGRYALPSEISEARNLRFLDGDLRRVRRRGRYR